MSKYFAAGLADKLAIAFLFNNFSFSHLRLLVCLLNIAFNWSLVNDFFAWRLMLGKRSIWGGHSFFTCLWVFALCDGALLHLLWL